MSYIPSNAQKIPYSISYISYESIGAAYRMFAGTTPSTGAWPVANKAIYIPFTLKRSIVVPSLFTANGTTASNSFDIGIYTVDGRKIVSTGTVAQSGVSQIQTVSITPTNIGPGIFYMALAMNGTTGTFLKDATPANVGMLSGVGIFQQTTAFNLPATATFAAASSIYVPVFGLSGITSI